ncbi:hypothetical protein CMI42_01775 [Candidatus Pacearchaeota archaeon]|nr:hypothetical protein [Candidatus Pacearchaeota archaeon]|tara:strand:+ start:525 stop:986 length:462 start_codon:yes stop_codon:yes gene_type:complete
MKLGEALSLLRKEKSRLARIISLRKENVYIYEDEKATFDPNELGKEIDKKIENIRKLKIKIQKTNRDITLNGGDISLAEAIIKVGDIRSKISSLSSLFEKKRDSWIYREKEGKKKIDQIDEQKVEEEIEELENEKSQLDSKIQIANWTSQLID